MKKSLLLLLIFTTLFAAAQKEADNWVFGISGALSFNSGVPVSFSGTMTNTQEGTASISDANGQLQFYTDGITVWNRNNVVMPNGSGLMGNSSTTQSALIVRQPDSTSIYYVFTLDQYGGANGLRYSIVDMTLQGGMGDVTTKNVAIYTPSSEKLSGALHANGKDVWIVSHEYNNNTFRAYLLTSTGFNSTAVTSTVGTINNDPIGYMKISPNGQKLALAVHQGPWAEFFDFDNSTGTVSNPIYTGTLGGGTYAYGVEFSPNSRYVYVSDYFSSHIYQWDLQAGSSAAILASKTTVASGSSLDYEALQLAVDGKIYIASQSAAYLHAIDSPNNAGTACAFHAQAVTLTGSSLGGLPNFLPAYLISNSFTYTTSCTNDTAFFTLSEPADSAKWNFGDPSSGINNNVTALAPFHVFSQPGTFRVTMVSYNNGLPDTSYQQVTANNLRVNLGNDTSLCNISTLTLNATTANATYRWQDGSTSPTFTATQAGTYSVNVTVGTCTVADTIRLTAGTIQVNLGNDTSFCNFSSYTLNATTAGATYQWQDGSTAPTYTATQAGTYSVHVAVGACTAADTIIISTGNIQVNLGNDTTICNLNSYVLNATTSGATYQWQDGSSAPTFTVTQAGTYSVKVTMSTCTATDTIHISNSNLQVSLGNDTSFCNISSYILNATTPGANYIWQDGSTGATYTVTQAGTYSVKVLVGACIATDTVHIGVGGLPPINITSTATTICSNDSVQLCAITGYSSYLWNNGQSSPCITTNLAGNYYVTVSDANNCTAVSNHLAVHVISQPPVSISVNGDTLTVYNATSVQWYRNDTLIPNATSNIYVAKTPGNYSVLITDTSGCSALSTPVVLTSIKNITANDFKIFPNPISGNVLWVSITSDLLGAEIMLFDADGRLVHKAVLNQLDNVLVLDIARGVYIVQITNNVSSACSKLIKM